MTAWEIFSRFPFVFCLFCPKFLSGRLARREVAFCNIFIDSVDDDDDDDVDVDVDDVDDV